jgi:hypothetical protein
MMSNDSPEKINAFTGDALRQDLLAQLSKLERQLLDLNLLDHPNEISSVCQQIFSLRTQLKEL